IAPEERAVEAGGARVTKVTAAPTPSRTEDRAGTEAQAVGSPTALDILAGSGAAVAAEVAARHSSRESPRDSVATEILETEDETSSEEQEADSVRKTPTGVLCEQIVPLLRYLDRKTAKYSSSRKSQSYVEIVKSRTRSKVKDEEERRRAEGLRTIEKEKDREKERERDKIRDKDREREKEREKIREKEKLKSKEKDRDSEKKKDRAKDPEKEKDGRIRDHDRDRGKEHEREKERVKDLDRERDKERDRGGDKDKKKEKDRSKKDRDKEREKLGEREKEREKDREKVAERDKDRDKEREREEKDRQKSRLKEKDQRSPSPTAGSQRRSSSPTASIELTVLLEIPPTETLPGLGQPRSSSLTGSPMADHQANLRQVFSQPFTKHSYPRYKGTGDDDDADSYIKLFESVSITNRETSDEDRLRIFPSLLRKRARSWYNHENTDPTGIRTWVQLKEKFLRRFRELGYDNRVLTRLRNLRRERKENLRDYMERFQDLLDQIPKRGPGEPFSVQQAVDWYVTGLSREMETFCMRGKADTIQDVIASAETFETSTLDTRRSDRRSTKKKSQGGRRKRRESPSSSEESSSSEASSSSEEEEDSSSLEEERRKKKHSAIKKLEELWEI
ncbi:hypothetical protein MARPO_0006s0274, partial [Marchantia polymorpha]